MASAWMLSDLKLAAAGGSQPMTFLSAGSLRKFLDAFAVLSEIQLFPAEYKDGT